MSAAQGAANRVAAFAVDAALSLVIGVGAGVIAAFAFPIRMLTLVIALAGGLAVAALVAVVMARRGGSIGQRIARGPVARRPLPASPALSPSPVPVTSVPPSPPVAVAALHRAGPASPPIATPVAAVTAGAESGSASHTWNARLAQQAPTRPFAVVPADPGPPPAVPVPARRPTVSEPILAVPGVRPHRHTHQAPPFGTPQIAVPVDSDGEREAAPRRSTAVLNDEFAAPTRRPAHAVLAWDDGTRASVYGRTLFGRNPAPEAGALTMVVRDESLTISKTHFEVRVEEGRAWVVDRFSTNGIVISRGGHRYASEPGVPTEILGGDQLELGDRYVTVTVTR